jgi:hypothetical protein
METILLSLGSLRIQLTQIYFVDTLFLAHYKNDPLHWCPFLTAMSTSKGHRANISEKGDLIKKFPATSLLNHRLIFPYLQFSQITTATKSVIIMFLISLTSA